MSIDLDVIIPVYNGEKFLYATYESLCQQTFKGFRVIFVNDGSTDKTGLIIEELKTKAPFPILVVNQENKGLPGARNSGILASTAKYISFIDCDDILVESHFQILVDALEKSKVPFGFSRYQTAMESHIEYCQDVGDLDYDVISGKEAMRFHYTNWIGPCSLIIDRKWLIDKRLFFDEKCKLSEDNVFVTSAFAVCEYACFIKNMTYVYITRKGSLLNGCDFTKLVIAYEGFQRMSDNMAEIDNESTKVFFEMGPIRFLMALLRRAARQLDFDTFLKFAEKVNVSRYKSQIKTLRFMPRVGAILYFFSPKLFYYVMRKSN